MLWGSRAAVASMRLIIDKIPESCFLRGFSSSKTTSKQLGNNLRDAKAGKVVYFRSSE